jgi:hypothetical protein
MASLAKSLKVEQPVDSPPKLKLTVSASLNRIPVPGTWSRGPVYKKLDSGFLEQPLIPKAPLAPRLRIDNINGSLRVIDAVEPPAISDMPPTLSLRTISAPPIETVQVRSKVFYQSLALAIGFAAGLAAAFFLGWF